ncbi:MAG TPA: hypothetical protein VHK88_05605, partial [Aquihabitans sp.]|nr:hypothetical protein [Aquihabitans sp.]
ADLQSPARIAREAEALGMVPTRDQRWVSPGGGGVAGTTTDTTADTTADTTDDGPSGGSPGSELAGATTEGTTGAP